jgi:hypothetical protein
MNDRDIAEAAEAAPRPSSQPIACADCADKVFNTDFGLAHAGTIVSRPDDFHRPAPIGSVTMPAVVAEAVIA